jgi:DNA-binding response OmpR family regulator
MKVLLMSPEQETRDLMRLVVRSVERATGEPLEFVEAGDGDEAARLARREHPQAIVADEIASRAGAFALALTLRGDPDPYRGAIVVLLDRRQDEWLARWSGADAWFVKPVDPFDLADRLAELVDRVEKEVV